ncbi:protein DEHYDRATION-INDUCED 19 homolog 4-like [Silene latifolia]
MEGGDPWSSNFSSSSFRRYQLRSDVYLGDDLEVEDEYKQEFSCPFCVEEFDVVGLFCHMDEEHQVELKNGVCPICVKRVGIDMVGHITTQHGNILKVQRKRRLHRGAPNSMFDILRKQLQEGNQQSLFRGSSFMRSSSNPDPDPLLSSFIYNSNTANDVRKEEPHSSKATCSLPAAAVEKSSESPPQPALSEKDHEEEARKCEFVQELLLSMMLDDIL